MVVLLLLQEMVVVPLERLEPSVHTVGIGTDLVGTPPESFFVRTEKRRVLALLVAVGGNGGVGGGELRLEISDFLVRGPEFGGRRGMICVAKLSSLLYHGQWPGHPSSLGSRLRQPRLHSE